MKISLFLYLIFAISVSGYGQSERLFGKVLDEKGNPITYANVGIKNTSIGTASNEQGIFQLYNSLGSGGDTLVVSCIGYKSFSVLITDLEDTNNITITLHEHTKVISGITISASDKNAFKIVEKALSRYKHNYTRKKYQLKGFYRQMMRNDDTYVMLTEGAFSMDDRGYRKAGVKKFRLDALRKSDDLRNMDSLDINYDTLLESNDLKGLFYTDFIDAADDDWSFYFWPRFNRNMLKEFDFLLDRLTYYEGNEVYKISLFPKRDLKNHICEYTMYIRRKDYALIEMRLMTKAMKVTYSTDTSRGNIGRLIDGKYYSKRIIQYQEYKGKWYPKYISSHSSLIGGDRQKSSRLAYERARERGENKLIYTNHKIKNRTIDPDKNNYFQFKELLITEIKDHKDKFRKIRKSELMDMEKYVRNHSMEYDPEFWENYNLIPMNPYLEKAKQHLSDSDKLKKQF